MTTSYLLPNNKHLRLLLEKEQVVPGPNTNIL
jgi:hypothetical protein